MSIGDNRGTGNTLSLHQSNPLIYVMFVLGLLRNLIEDFQSLTDHKPKKIGIKTNRFKSLLGPKKKENDFGTPIPKMLLKLL